MPSEAAVCLLCLSLSWACRGGARNEATATSPQDMIATSRLVVTVDRLVAEGDVSGLAALFAEDAVVMPPGETTLLGRRAIRARAEALLEARSFETRHEPLEVDAAGPYLIQRGLARVSPSPPPNDSRFGLELRYIYVLKRAGGDSLLIWRAILNRASD